MTIDYWKNTQRWIYQVKQFALLNRCWPVLSYESEGHPLSSPFVVDEVEKYKTLTEVFYHDDLMMIIYNNMIM